jgi:hypothetical protein
MSHNKCVFTRKIIWMVLEQLKDMFPVLIATIGMVLIIVVILATIDDWRCNWSWVGFRIILHYLGICRMLKIEELNEF